MIGMKMNVNVGVGLVLTLMTLKVQAHIALWDEAMYGWDESDINQYQPVLPLERLPFNQWWFHNYIDKPPAPGKIMNLPAGGTYHGQVACNKAWTTYNPHGTTAEYACDDDKPGSGTGAMHTTDRMGDPNPKDVKGCGLSIAYESDVHKLKPEDFTVISIAYDCPWKKNVDFHIPADLPPCPEGGCHCSWGWVHSKDGGSAQMYQLGYRCDVTGATLNRALPKPLVSRKCDFPNDVSNCTVGAKQPHYWLQKEGNNNFQGDHDPPFYNHEMGFMNGAQTDLFAGVPEETAPAPAPSAANIAPQPSSEVAIEPTSETSPSVEEASSTQEASSVGEPSFARLAPTSTVTPEPSPTSQPMATSTSVSLSPNQVASSAASAITAVVNTAAAAPSPSASKAGRCRRRRRRSVDVQRHLARSKNRTLGVRHTTALAA